MEQAQILAKWLMMVRTARHELRETGNVKAADVALDRLSVQIMMGKIFGLPVDVPVYREDAREVINAYVDSVIARVESIASRGNYDKAKHARDAQALDDLLGALPAREPSQSPSSDTPSTPETT
jgi:hypothetical protein